MTPKKLVILGGGSLNTPAFFAALAHHSGLVWDEICLIDRSEEAVEIVGRFCRSIVERSDVPVTVTWETDVARAVAGAQYVLNMIRVGGIEGRIEDCRNLALSGIVGHAASYAEAIPNIPATLDLIRKIGTVAPDAVFVNFANPVSLLCEAIAAANSITCIGICYHAFLMRDDVASLLGVQPQQVHVEYLGLNHLGWVTDVQVDGHSQMSRLVNTMITRRVKKYNYQLIRPFGLIPIDHAFSLYRKGEVLYVRQKGIRGSLQDVLFKYVVADGHAARLRRERDELKEAIRTGRSKVLDLLKARAPWYETCIVPFLAALDSGRPREFIVTWRHEGQMPGLPVITAESTAVVEGRQVRNAMVSASLPEFAVAWLQQVRNSEHLLIRAIREQSFDTALQALAIHPNVASVQHAERFLQHYFPLGAQDSV